MNDLISRQAAIEYFMINTNWHDEEGYPIDDWDEKRKLLEDYFNGVPSAQPEVYWSERCKDCKWNCFSGCSIVHNNEELPSAQPEIVRCKDCAYSFEAYGDLHCEKYCHYSTPDDFCSRGERRTP